VSQTTEPAVFQMLTCKSGKHLAFIVSRGTFEHELEWELR
jgi:hypothetical protein